MTLPTIPCCYTDCGVRVWAPAKGRLDVHCSSATCVTCRRVALCLRHFEAVRAQQGDLRCPNCGSKRWHAVLFEPVKLPSALASEVSDERGHIEVRFVSTGTTADIEPVEPPRLSVVAPPPPPSSRPPEWRLVRATELGAGVRSVRPGLAFRADGDGAELLVEDTIERPPMRVSGVVRSMAHRSSAVLVERAASAQATSSVRWFSADGRDGHLPNPFQLGVRGPTFVSDDSFVFLVDLPDGRSELREGRFDGPGRLETRRVGRSWRLAGSAPCPAVVGGHTAVLFALAEDGYTPTGIRLDDGRETTIGSPQAAARVAVGARDTPLSAWVNTDSEVRCGGPGRDERVLGACGTDLLALSPDGQQVAWVDGPLHVADTGSGEVTTWSVPDDVVSIGWGG